MCQAFFAEKQDVDKTHGVKLVSYENGKIFSPFKRTELKQDYSASNSDYYSNCFACIDILHLDNLS